LLPWFPEIAADLARLPPVIIDGELVIQDPLGKPDFHKLRGRCAIRDPSRIAAAAGGRPAAVFAFDLLYANGEDYKAQPLLKRKAGLQQLSKQLERICYCQYIGEKR